MAMDSKINETCLSTGIKVSTEDASQFLYQFFCPIYVPVADVGVDWNTAQSESTVSLQATFNRYQDVHGVIKIIYF